MTTPLLERLTNQAYNGYAYSYPHKTAYRRLVPAIKLKELWSNEPTDALFLYVHVPFCESRCDYCNLFSVSHPDKELAVCYLEALRRQAKTLMDTVDSPRFAQVAIGGGTPSLLSERQLESLLDILENVMGAELGKIPVCVEVSPSTCSLPKLQLLRDAGIDRISLGVQSFVSEELMALGRKQQTRSIDTAFQILDRLGFPTVNVDLIYGLPGQSVSGFRQSVREAVEHGAEEVYLYPLYTRPGTQLDGLHRDLQLQLTLYREARQELFHAGYVQRSMRRFKKPEARTVDSGLGYECQRDGMIGLGCGARSYTRLVHYSDEYAVSGRDSSAILREYSERSRAEFELARHGFVLDEQEGWRRHVIKTLLLVDGVDRTGFSREFGIDVLDALPDLRELTEIGLSEINPTVIRLNSAGLELSDAIGPWLYSSEVRSLMEQYQCR